MLIDKIKITHFTRFLMFTLFSNPPPRLLPLASLCALLPPSLPPSLFPPLLFSVLGGWPEDSCAKPLAYIQVHSTQTDTAGCCSGFPGREQEPSTRGGVGGEGGWRKRGRAAEEEERACREGGGETEGWRGGGETEKGCCEVIFHHRVHFSLQFSHSVHRSISLYLSSPPSVPLP